METGCGLFFSNEEGARKRPIDMTSPLIVVPLPMRVLEPGTKGEAERNPEAMVLLFQVLEACSPVNYAV